MNRMYHIKRYIEDKALAGPNGKSIISIDRIIELFLQYLDDNSIVYGEGEFHFLAKNGITIIDEKR